MQRALQAIAVSDLDGLTEAVKNISPRSLQKGSEGGELLRSASANGFLEGVRFLVGQGVPINNKRSQALHVAAASGRADVVRFLIEKGAWRNLVGDGESLPFECALRNGHVAVACDLAGSGASKKKDLMLLAADQCDEEVAQRIADAGGLGALAKAPGDMIVRMIRMKRPGLVRLFLRAGVRPDGSAGGVPYTLIAATGDDARSLEVLLAAKAPVDVPGPQGVTPLMQAALWGSPDMVGLLVGAKADVAKADAAGRTALHYAVLSGRAEPVRLLLRGGAGVAVRDADDRTPLDLALVMQAGEIVDALVDSGARLDPRNTVFGASIVQAIALDRLDLVQDAVAAGWQPDAVLVGEITALRCATMFDAGRVVAWLRDQCPEETPVEVARSVGVEPACVEMVAPEDMRLGDHCAATEVEVSGVVDVAGGLTFPRVVRCPDPRLALGVLQAAARWRFQPAQEGGTPVAARTTVLVPIPARSMRAFRAEEVDTPAVLDFHVGTGQALVRVPDTRQRSGQLERWSARRLENIRFLGGGWGYIVPYDPEERSYVSVPSYESAIVVAAIEADGRISAVRVLHANRSEYARKVEQALINQHAEPGVLNGCPVRSTIIAIVNNAADSG